MYHLIHNYRSNSVSTTYEWRQFSPAKRLPSRPAYSLQSKVAKSVRYGYSGMANKSANVDEDRQVQAQPRDAVLMCIENGIIPPLWWETS